MEYRIIKQDVSEIASKEEIERIEKVQDKDERDGYAASAPLSELFDMCIYFKILAEEERKELFALHIAKDKGEGVTGFQIAAQRQNIARNMAASFFWNKALQNRINSTGKTFNVNIKIKELMSLIIAEDQYEGTKSKKTATIKAKKQALIDEIKEVVNGLEPGEE